MSDLLNQTIVLGWPDSGKSHYLRTLDCPIFTPLDKKKDGSLKFYFIKPTFKQTQILTKRKLEDYISTQEGTIYLDEPFYYMLPFKEDSFQNVLTKDYVIATHRTAYFMLNSPKIVLIENASPKEISPNKLEQLIEPPSIGFFESDTKNYASFLNKFKDIYVSEAYVQEVLNNSLMREVRTTYLVRDFLIWSALYGNKNFDSNIKNYVKTVGSFFKKYSKELKEPYKRVIRKALGSFLEVD